MFVFGDAVVGAGPSVEKPPLSPCEPITGHPVEGKDAATIWIRAPMIGLSTLFSTRFSFLSGREDMTFVPRISEWLVKFSSRQQTSVDHVKNSGDARRILRHQVKGGPRNIFRAENRAQRHT